MQVSKWRMVQLKSGQTEQLLNKPYVNEVHLTGQNLAYNLVSLLIFNILLTTVEIFQC